MKRRRERMKNGLSPPAVPRETDRLGPASRREAKILVHMPRSIQPPALLFLAALLAPLRAGAATIEIPHATLLKLLTDETAPDGRRFLAGKPGDSCNWGYVVAPSIATVREGLEIRGRVRGAIRVLGICTALGRELPIRAVATPVFAHGVLSFRTTEVALEGESGGRLTRFLLERMLARVRLDLRKQLGEMASGAHGPGGIGFALLDFDVRRVELLPDRTRLDVDFDLEIR